MQPGIGETEPAPVAKTGVEISHLAKLRDNPALVHQLFIPLELPGRVVASQ